MKGIVFGSTFEHAVKKLQEIENNYIKCHYNIISKRKSKYSYEIHFDNGDYWQAIPAREGMCRGRRCNIAYIDININKDFIDCVIKPYITLPPYTAINYYL